MKNQLNGIKFVVPDKLWGETQEYVFKHMPEINDFLRKGVCTKDTTRHFLFDSLSLVISELKTNKDKYPAITIKEENWVDITIESIGEEVPPLTDFDASIEYIENFRSLIWGYIRNHEQILTLIFWRSSRKKKKELIPFVDEPFLSFLIKCATLVYCECFLRKLEELVLQYNAK